MSFFPLPPTFLEALQTARAGRFVEIGCGDGRFTALLTTAGARPWALDRRPPWVGSVAQVVADGRRLPLLDASLDLLVAANLLHHLWSPRAGSGLLDDWRRCLAPGGRLFIFEDEPAARPLAVRNHRDLQAFLARLDPQRRRPLLARGEFRRRQAGLAGGGVWRFGRQLNETAVADLDSLRGWLLGDRQAATGEARRLATAIGEHGLSYGHYWWASWSREGSP